MAVFVRFFRVAMLFFNVYDSYKVLKLPPPSAQNKGRPSLRAMSQRKRDMKGCLAVWIVWSSFVIYERFAEVIISLFVPFYDEFKSLAMLFLIMTRARGAEPIYLHIIRPFLKPYTSTIDQLLDFAHVVGDVVLGLAALPFIYVIEWWQRRFGTEPETLDTETEASSSPLSAVPGTKSRPPIVRANTDKTMKPTSIPTSKGRQPATSRPSTGNQKKVDQHEAPHVSSTAQVSRNTAPAQDLPTSDTTQIDGLPVTDEWRQYPAFPSAYPPTPLAKHTEVVAAATVISKATLYPPIAEELAQQDFRQSLMPPHSNSNPSCAGDLSDDHNIDGVQPAESKEITISVMEVDDYDESMAGEDEYESEDEFNITLRTPDPLRILTSLEPPIGMGDDVSPLSLPSRSALSTSDNASSLRTPSAESTFSSDVPVDHLMPSGRKRSRQPTTSSADNRLRVSRITNRGTAVKVARSTRSPVKRVVIQRHPQRALQNGALRPVDKPRSTESEMEPSFNSTASHDNEQLALKRRRVSLLPPKAVQVTQPVRRRVTVTRQTSPPKKVTRVVATHGKPSPRPRTKTNEKLAGLSSREGSPDQEDSVPVFHET